MENIIKKLQEKYTLQESINSVDDIVEPTFLRLSLGGVIDKFNSVSDDYKTDWSKLLIDVKKSKGILSNLIKGLFGTYGGSIEYLIDLNTDEMSVKDVTMVFAGTPDKKQQEELVKVFQESLGPQYEIVLINGDETSNRKAEELSNKVVAKAKREGRKVVLISKDMGSRSFSVSEIDTVILMFDRGQYNSISQKISRVLTPGITFRGEKKIKGFVISLSLDPNRFDVNPIDEYVIYESEKVQVNELSDGINRVLRSINIFTNYDGDLESIQIDEYSDKLINSSSLIKLGKASSNPDSIICDDDIVRLLTGIQLNKNNVEKQNIEGIDLSLVNKFKGDKEKTNSVSKEKDVELTEIENIRTKLRQQLENIVDNVVEISEINNCESDDIIDCLKKIKGKGFEDEVIFEVDMNCDTIIKIIQMGGVSHKLLNTIITSYNKEEKLLLC
jgi:hypothetical protein